MKSRAQMTLIAAVLLGMAAWSSMPRGARSTAVGANGGSCCPLLAGTEVRKPLSGQESLSSTNQVELPPAPDYR